MLRNTQKKFQPCTAKRPKKKNSVFKMWLKESLSIALGYCNASSVPNNEITYKTETLVTQGGIRQLCGPILNTHSPVEDKHGHITYHLPLFTWTKVYTTTAHPLKYQNVPHFSQTFQRPPAWVVKRGLFADHPST